MPRKNSRLLLEIIQAVREGENTLGHGLIFQEYKSQPKGQDLFSLQLHQLLFIRWKVAYEYNILRQFSRKQQLISQIQHTIRLHLCSKDTHTFPLSFVLFILNSFTPDSPLFIHQRTIPSPSLSQFQRRLATLSHNILLLHKAITSRFLPASIISYALFEPLLCSYEPSILLLALGQLSRI